MIVYIVCETCGTDDNTEATTITGETIVTDAEWGTSETGLQCPDCGSWDVSVEGDSA